MSSPPRRRRRRRLYPALAALLLPPLLAAIAFAAARPSASVESAGAGAAPAASATADRSARNDGAPAGGRRGRERGAEHGAREAAKPAHRRKSRRHEIAWRRSVAVGAHSAGRLERGVLLPPEGRNWVSWDPIKKRRPSREWRRWGTDTMIRATLGVIRGFRAQHRRAPRIVLGDLSRPEGGDFGPQYGSLGHASHQNGLDIDVYYPRTDRKLRPPKRPSQVDVRLSQRLLDRFVAAGAEKVFVGPSLPLRGPEGVVAPLVHHDNHLHVRFPLNWAR